MAINLNPSKSNEAKTINLNRSICKPETTTKSTMSAVREFFFFDVDKAVDSMTFALATAFLRQAWRTPSYVGKLTYLSVSLLQGKIYADRQETKNEPIRVKFFEGI